MKMSGLFARWTSASIGAGRPAESRARRAPLTYIAGCAVLGLLLALVQWRERPPTPRGADTPATAFAEARAMATVRHLAEVIGTRATGTRGQQDAVDYLAAQLRAIPGIEVDVQIARALNPESPHGAVETSPRVTNVLARVPGDQESSVLLSAHYDSPPESVGAADNALAVGALVEVARALSVGPRLRHTVIINLNGAEESGLLGSIAFLDHAWAKHVRAFINLDAAGSGGKAVLFQSGPGHAWLLEAYARAAPRPYGTVVGQDIFQSGAIHAATDFGVYHARGHLAGLDMALFRDGYSYHTDLDRVARLEPGSMQHLGDNVLAVTRELALADLPAGADDEPAVYYDVLGLTMFAYTRATAWRLAALALALGAFAVALVLRRTRVTWRELLAGLAVSLAAVAVGLGLALGAALALGVGLRRPHGWFSAPYLAAVAYGACAVAGSLAVHACWARRGGDPETRRWAAWAGGLALWMALLLAMMLGGLGVAYVGLWWVGFGAAALILALARPSLGPTAELLAVVPGALVSIQVASLLLGFAVPLAGRLLLPIPFDPIVAALVALPTLGGVALAASALHRAGGMGRTSALCAAIAVCALAATGARSPYTPERPKRIWVEHEEQAGQPASLRLQGFDFPDLEALVAALPPGDWKREPARFRQHFARSAPPTGLSAPTLRLVSSSPGPNGRTVRLRVEAAEAGEITLRVPRERVRGWDWPEPLPPPDADEPLAFEVHIPAGAGWEASLHLEGAAPVWVECQQRLSVSTDALSALRAQLPAWVTPFLFVTLRNRQQV